MAHGQLGQQLFSLIRFQQMQRYFILNFKVKDSLFYFFIITFKPSEFVISTIETTRQTYFLSRLLDREKMILIVGPTGTGKTSIINGYLYKLPRDKYLLNNLNFSARTTASQTQDIVMSKMSR